MRCEAAFRGPKEAPSRGAEDAMGVSGGASGEQPASAAGPGPAHATGGKARASGEQAASPAYPAGLIPKGLAVALAGQAVQARRLQRQVTELQAALAATHARADAGRNRPDAPAAPNQTPSGAAEAAAPSSGAAPSTAGNPGEGQQGWAASDAPAAAPPAAHPACEAAADAGQPCMAVACSDGYPAFEAAEAAAPSTVSTTTAVADDGAGRAAGEGRDLESRVVALEEALARARAAAAEAAAAAAAGLGCGDCWEAEVAEAAGAAALGPPSGRLLELVSELVARLEV